MPAIRRHRQLVLPVAVAILMSGSSAAFPPKVPPREAVPFAAMLDTLERERDPKLRLQTFYRMLFTFEHGTVRFDGATEAERFARVMSRLMLSDTATTVSWQAADLMVRFPHPAAADALLEVAGREGPRFGTARSSALEALVALHDARVLPLLQAELGRPRGNLGLALRLIGELGDPRGLAILSGFRGDSALRDRLIDVTRSHQVREDRIESLAAERFATLQAAAARAERDLRRVLDDQIVCSFDLDDEAYRKLARQGFVIRDEGGKELYEFLSAAYPCVTSDVAFHAFVLVARGALGEVDSLVLAPRILEFCEAMGEACAHIAERSPAGLVREAAWRNAAFFGVPVSLLGGRPPRLLPPALAESVATDLALIRSNGPPGPSAVLGSDEDFAKYVPRGRLSSVPELAGYFQAMTWLGRANLAVRDPDALRRALVMTAAVRSDTALVQRWRELDLLLRDLYGPPDDVTFDDLARAARRLGGRRTSLLAVAEDPEALAALSRSLVMPPPRISTGYARSWGTWRPRTETTGLRVLGQRYSRSADLFQQLLERGVWPPSGLDVAAQLMGSQQAATLRRPSSMPVEIPPGAGAPGALPPGVGGLPEGALTTLAVLFQPDRRQPAFMRQPAWEEKQINTALAGWAEVLNLTAPFVKDANTYMGGSAMTDRVHGWVEPVPRFYGRLDSLTRELARRLDRVGAFTAIESSRSRALAAHPVPPTRPGGWTQGDFEANQAHRNARIRVDRTTFADLSSVLQRLAEISERELRGEGQSIDDGVFLKSLRYRFKSLAFNHSNSDHAVEPMAVISDPATEYQSGQCLEVGTGRPRAIYVTVPDGHRKFVCRGGVYSYHEFTRPIGQRLDDLSWRRMVKDGGSPPPWMDSRPALAATGRAAAPTGR